MIGFDSVNTRNEPHFLRFQCLPVTGDGESVEVDPEVPGDDVQVDHRDLLLESVPQTRPDAAPLLTQASQVSADGQARAGHDAVDVRPSVRGREVPDPAVLGPARHVIHPKCSHIGPASSDQLPVRLGIECERGPGDVNKHAAACGHGALGGQSDTEQLLEAPVRVGWIAVVNRWVENKGQSLTEFSAEAVTIVWVITD